MKITLDRWGATGWSTPVYHPRANPVERRNQELKKGLRAQLVTGKHTSWDTKLASILFSIRNRRNEQTGHTPATLVLGRECRRPGDWALLPVTHIRLDELNKDRSAREEHVLGNRPTTGGHMNSKFCEGDVVYYKSHHLSKAHEHFHAGFAPKWWGPVTLAERVGNGVFLTDQTPQRKVHVSCLKHASTNRP